MMVGMAIEEIDERLIIELVSKRAKETIIEAHFELTPSIVANTKIRPEGIKRFLDTGKRVLRPIDTSAL